MARIGEIHLSRRRRTLLDSTSRRLIAAPLDAVAGVLDRRGISPDAMTFVGLGLGLGAAYAAGVAAWWWALGLWLGRCLADGLDGPLARLRVAAGARPSVSGAYLDICCDFVVYGAFVLGVGIGADGSLLPFFVVMLAYYLNGSFFLAFSSLAERSGRQIQDGRSLSFIGGLAEGTETVVVHCLWCLFPGVAPEIAWVWAGVVLVSAAGRLLLGYRALR